MNFVKSIPPKYMHDVLGIYPKTNLRIGWYTDMDRAWFDSETGIEVCSRLIRTQFGNVEHVTITRTDKISNDGSGDIPWVLKQQIKDELFGKNRFAIEVFPKEKNLLDTCDVYHLWVFDKKCDMPFGISRKEYQNSINRGYSVTEEDLKKLQAEFAKAGKL